MPIWTTISDICLRKLQMSTRSSRERIALAPETTGIMGRSSARRSTLYARCMPDWGSGPLVPWHWHQDAASPNRQVKRPTDKAEISACRRGLEYCRILRDYSTTHGGYRGLKETLSLPEVSPGTKPRVTAAALEAAWKWANTVFRRLNNCLLISVVSRVSSCC